MNWIFRVSVACIIVAGFLLVTGSEILQLSLGADESFPFGTIVTWVGMVSLPVATRLGIQRTDFPGRRKSRLINRFLLASIALAILWGFVSYYLADNWAFTFRLQEQFRGSNRASRYFWYYSALVVLLPIFLLFAHMFFKGQKTLTKS